MSSRDRNSYYEVVRSAPVLLRFACPDTAALSRIRECLSGLVATPDVSSEDPNCALEKASFFGTLDEMMTQIQHSLEAEYQDNVTCDRSFSHEVTESVLTNGGVDIIIWLSTNGGEGRVGYGYLIHRLADDRYALWSPD